MKPKYKVIRWQTDGTEEIWEAPQKPTFQEMYKLINCTTIEDNQDMTKTYQIERLICGWMKKAK